MPKTDGPLMPKSTFPGHMRVFHLETIHFAEIHKIAGPGWGSTFDFGFWVFNLR